MATDPTILINTPPPHACLSATGVVGDVVYRVKQSGAWEIFIRNKPAEPALGGGAEVDFAAAWRAARKAADYWERYGRLSEAE